MAPRPQGKRVCARAGHEPQRPAVSASRAADEPAVREIAEERQALRARIVEFVRERGSTYSAEVADAVGLRCGTAKAHLVALQQLGLLDSDYEPPAPGASSGLGRRYYRVAGPAPGAARPGQSPMTAPAVGALRRRSA